MSNMLFMCPFAPPAAPETTVARRYQPARVRALFDGLADTYGCASWLSGGLLSRWRRQLVASLRRPVAGPAVVVDLMAGGAELWPPLRRRFGPELRVAAVDSSAPMLARAVAHAASPSLTLHPADALATALPSAQATAVTCAFGLKTLPPTAYQALANEAARLLRPGGEVALVEFVLPRHGWTRGFALGYLAALLPVLRTLYPDTADHADLPRYASTGPDLGALRHSLRQAGFEGLRQQRLWPGCAVLLTAVKQEGNE